MKQLLFHLTVLLTLASQLLQAQPADGPLTVAGRVIDAQSGQPLHYASVTLSETGVSNITNSEGFFTLKLPAGRYEDRKVTVSHLGYALMTVGVTNFEGTSPRRPLTIRMLPASVTLDPATIRAVEAESLVATAFERVGVNYPDKKMGLTAFYREMIKKGNTRYLSLNEAIIDINKASYKSRFPDRAAIYKGRGSTNYESSDTLLIHFQGGVIASLTIDQAKNPFASVLPGEMFKSYDFHMEPMEQRGDRLFHVVGFKQADTSSQEILFRGRLFIDSESYGIGRVEMNMNVEGREDAAQIFIRKRPAKTRIAVESASYVVNYKLLDGLWHYDYARIEIRITEKRRYSLFRNRYSIVSELAVTDRSLEEKPIGPENRIRFTDQLSKKVVAFTDEHFWEDYNIIEPDESIDVIVKKIVRQLKRREKNN